MDSMAKLAKWAMYFCLLGWGVTLMLMSRLPDYTEIDPSLLQEPLQATVPTEKFLIDYRNQKNSVMNVATYDIRGLIVSHNDPFVWYRFDITHDEDSLNTRDICVMWGDNLKTNDFKRVSVHNDDSFCIYDYGPEVRSFNPSKLSNNHLIANKQAIRDAISGLVVGDQVHITGKLVNYSEERWGERWRRSSMGREDTGDGSCEIILVESIRVLKSHNALWAAMNDWLMIGAIIAFCVRLLLFLLKPVPRYKPKKRVISSQNF